MKTVHIRTYGCQMNVYDSARMADALKPFGFAAVDAALDADLVVLNTCHIRDKAAEKVYSELGRLAEAKAERAGRGRPLLIAVAGCVAQAEGEEIRARAPCVDIVVGPQAYHRLPGLVAAAERAGGFALDIDFPVESKFDYLPAVDAHSATIERAAAFLTVQEGCDKFCSFCVVPYTRGSEASRPAAPVLVEALSLVRAGVREITLLGQNVNNYHGRAPNGAGDWGLARLIAALAEIDGLERIRYATSYPADMDEALIAAHRDVVKLMPYLHLPVQSGSDSVLAAMGRRHNRTDYLRLVDRLRAARPDLALASDFIVGFPGETEADFAETIDLVDRVGFAQAYSFKFSPRPGTPAATLADQIPEAEKTERLARLQAAVDRHRLAFNRATVGRTMPVLLDGRGRRPGQLAGRSPYMQSVHVEGPDHHLGRIVSVAVVAGYANSVEGRIAATELTRVPA